MSTEVLFREPASPGAGTEPVKEERVSDVKRPVPVKPDHIRTEMTLVTPELAAVKLETMHTNRSKSRLEVGVMEALLAEGNFFGGISPVFLDADGRAWDGQHRFESVVATGISAWMLFIHGVTRQEADYIDTGRARTYADTLKMQHVSDYSRQAVVSRMLALYKKSGIDGVRQPAGEVLTRAEKDEWVNSPGMEAAVKAGGALSRAVKANTSYAAYALLQTAARDADGVVVEIDPDGFWESVRTGADLKVGDAALTLRNYLLGGRVKASKSGTVDPRLMELYILATAWNKHVIGERWTRPNPIFETKRDGSSKYFPASQVPDFLPLDARSRGIGQLRAAFGAVQRETAK